MIVRAMSLGLALWLVTSVAAGQSATRRPVRRGDVTGVELGIDGLSSVTRGGVLRWGVTAYEVVGVRDLRIAPGAEIKLFTSIDPATPAAEETADAFGRATLTFSVPEDAPDRFMTVIELRAPVGASRRFEVPVQVTEPTTVRLGPLRPPHPGGELLVYGRATQADGRGPEAGFRGELSLRDENGRPLVPDTPFGTDPAGMFAHTFRVPEDVNGAVVVTVQTRTDRGVRQLAQMHTAVQARRLRDFESELLVSVAPAQVVVAPRSSVPTVVLVRDADGHPVEDATIQVSNMRTEDRRRVRTDARGIARISWPVPGLGSGHRDIAIGVTADRAGVGSGTGQAVVRVAADRYAIGASVEGGVLPSQLGGRVYARVVHIDGSAAAGLEVRLSGPRVAQTLVETTDRDGVAVFEVELGAQADNDRCGGQAATDMTLVAESDGASVRRSICAGLDPDASARVRVDPRVAPGGAAQVTVARTRGVAQAPVALTFWTGSSGAPRLLARAVIPAGANSLEVAMPAGVLGRVEVRARPVMGAAELRGGTAHFLVAPPSHILQPQVSSNGQVELTFEGSAASLRSVYAVALPVDDARGFHAWTESETGTLFGSPDPTPGLVGASLAATASLDIGAAAVLQGRDVVALPDPNRQEILRDPFRTRDRFVTGRLALLFRALEQHVAAAVPGRIEDVAVQRGRGFEFNRQIIAGLEPSSLGAEGSTGLGGEPLTIDRLEALDSAFRYDSVARRITRRRLFRLVLALRQYARSNSLDLTWSWVGEPAGWLRQLIGQPVPGGGGISARDLADGWGRPFELRPARGGRARFRVVEPLAGFEIISAGIDGRVGNGDDVWDPTARVLPEGSLYAEAVGETQLLARLRGAVLGRSTIQLGAGTIGVGVPGIPAPNQTQAASAAWTFPSRIEPNPAPLALHRPAAWTNGDTTGVQRYSSEGAAFSLEFGNEPRTWGVVVTSWTDEGAGATALRVVRAGSPLLVASVVPERLRVNEPIAFELRLTNVTDERQNFVIEPARDGALQVNTPGEVAIPPGESRFVPVTLQASQHRAANLELGFRRDDETVFRIQRELQVDTGRRPVRFVASRFSSDWSIGADIPSDAMRPTGRLLLFSPRALGEDPELRDARRTDPALVAWAQTMGGRSLRPWLRARLLRAQSPDGSVDGVTRALPTACAVVAWSSADPDDEQAQQALRQGIGALQQQRTMVDSDGEAGRIRGSATVLTALAAGGFSDDVEGDPLGQVVAEHRALLRGVVRRHPERAELLARAAASLLVADPEDLHGRAALARLERGLDGELPEPVEGRRHRREQLNTWMAYALALHQAGRSDEARRVLERTFDGSTAVHRLAGETLFWHLALGAYGAYGVGAREVEVDAGSGRESLALPHGFAAVEVDPRASVSFRSTDGGLLFARYEVGYGRSWEPQNDGGLALAIRGEVGPEGGRAGLQLKLEATRDVRSPWVEIQLPAGVDGADVRDRLRENGGVRHAEIRRPGFVTLHLRPLEDGQELELPLAFKWEIRGEVRGLGVVAFDGATPREMSVLRPRLLQPTRADD
ncbi:MAG: hypothetical protein AAGF12_13300 [Myxococcota bacterium]